MSDEDRLQDRYHDDANQLKARIEALKEPHLAFREAWMTARQRVTELGAETARLRGDSQALLRDVVRVRLPRDPSCGATGRRVLDEYFYGLPDGVASDAKTVASELINNAYRHGEGTIDLRVRRDNGRVRIDVADEGSTGAVRVRRGDGRGLEIVNALSPNWGAYAGSTHVWAELPIRPDDR